MALFLTADLHLGHKNILTYCPARGKQWASVNAMDEALIANWNRVVQPEDTVYIIGDFALGNQHFQQRCVEACQGRKVLLIRGNHDGSITRCKRNGFTEVYDELKIAIGAQEFLLNHFPRDNTAPRFQARKPIDTGLPLLCGHVHQHWLAKGRMYNVGIDQHNFFPVPESTIVAWAASLPQIDKINTVC